MIRLAQLDESNRAAFLELLREPWQQETWDDALAREIVQWRYLDRSDDSVTWLAMEQDRCVAMLDSMLRPYLLDGQRILVRETADWYCIPQLRSRGVGLQLMFHLRKYPEPVFVLGGSPSSVSILSKMRGWATLPTATSFVFPLKVRGVAANWIRRKRWAREPLARAIPGFLSMKAPRRIKPPHDRRAVIRVLARDDAISSPMPQNVGLIQLFEQENWEWLVKMPQNLARPMALEFFLDDVLVGFSLSQVEPTITGRDGRITYLQATDPSLFGWIVSATTRRLADCGVGFIRSCASIPSKIDAMRDVGYVKVQDVACHWGQRSPQPISADVGYLTIDALIPFSALRGRVPKSLMGC